MRALCGAIIAAGAMLGLGLTAVGMGVRYAGFRTSEGNPDYVLFKQMDTPLMYITVFLSLVLVIGLGIAFFGLAYHHHRRWYEHQRVTEEHEEKRPSRNRSSAK
jgi:hypothetical protein